MEAKKTRNKIVHFDKKVMFRVSANEYAKIKLYCKENSTTISKLIRDFIREKTA